MRLILAKLMEIFIFIFILVLLKTRREAACYGDRENGIGG
jgi:hypothetical protein